MLENTHDGEQLQILYVGYCSSAFLCSDGIYILKTPSLGPEKSWFLDVRSHFLFHSSKNICQISSRSLVLSRGSLAPTLPLIPQPLHPPLLSNPAALPLVCVLHLLDYSTFSKHSDGVALNSQKWHLPLFFLSTKPTVFFLCLNTF